MAKTDLRTNPKFKKLCRRLDMPEPYIVGHLECLWLTSYNVAANPIHFKDFEEIEAAADWRGVPDVFAQVLVDLRFLDKVEGGFIVHDMAEHAPDFVEKRLKRAAKKTETADNGGQRRTTADNGPIEQNRTEQNRNENKGTENKTGVDELQTEKNYEHGLGVLSKHSRNVAALFENIHHVKGKTPNVKSPNFQKFDVLVCSPEHDETDWPAVADKVANCGEFLRKFTPALEWIAKPENTEKILRGDFDNKQSTTTIDDLAERARVLVEQAEALSNGR